MGFNSFRIAEVSTNLDYKRIPLSSAQREKRKGVYRYYGAQGVIDYIDDYIFDGTYLLIAEDGENLKSNKKNIAQIVKGRFWVNNHAHILQENEKSDLKYLYYAICNTDISGFITGSAQPKLSQGNLNNIVIQMPELETQRNIAATLSCLDDKIELNNRIIANLEAQAQAIFKSWFVDFEAFQDGEFEESELGLIPKGWRCGAFSDLGNIEGGSTPSKSEPSYYCENGIPWITPRDLSSDKRKFIDRGANDITESGLKNSSAKILPAWTVLFSSRAPIGYITIAKNGVSTNQGFKSVVPFKEVGTAYVYYYLKQNTDRIIAAANGSTFKEISGTVLKSLPALIPEAQILKEFSAFCETLFKQQAVLEEQNGILTITRDTLLPKLISGKIEVPVDIKG